jgi:hypothetical protein
MRGTAKWGKWQVIAKVLVRLTTLQGLGYESREDKGENSVFPM